MKFNVLYLSETSRLGGAEESLLNLVRFIDKERFGPYFVVPEDGPLVNKLKSSGAKVFIVAMPKIRGIAGVISAANAILKIARENKISLLHTNSIRTHLYGAYAAKLMNLPLVWHERNLITGEFFDPDRVFSFLPDKVICNSFSIAERFKQNGRLPGKVSVIYSGVDTERFNPRLDGRPIRKEFGIGPEETVIGIASRFGRDKGHRIFLECAKIILSGGHIAGGVKFLVAGSAVFDKDHSMEKYLRDEAQDLGIADNVIFAGFREDMPSFYAVLDVFVLASDAEPCGRVVLEALAAGRAIVATKSGGTPEMVIDGSSGILVAPQDPAGMAEKIIYLAKNREIAAEMGKNSRKRAEEIFGIAGAVKKIESIYEDLGARKQNNIMKLDLKNSVKQFYLMVRAALLSPFLSLRKTRIPEPVAIKKILVLRNDRIGDMVLSTPAFKALKEKYPAAEIIVVASKTNRDIVRNNPYVDKVLVYDGIWEFFKAARKEKADLAIDLFYTYQMKQAFLAYISASPYKIGFENAGREVFFNIKGPDMNRSEGMTGHVVELLRYLGVEVHDVKPQLYLSPEDAKWAEDYLKSKNIHISDLKVAIHAGGFYPSQRWGLDRFARLAKRIADEFHAKIIFLTGNDEERLLKKIEPLIAGRDDIVMARGLTLTQSIALVSKCSVFVGNNSGMLHVACALGLPTVSTMGPTDPVLWAPAGERNIVLRKSLECSPCGKAGCGPHSCMDLITVEDMMDAVRRQLEKIL